MGAWFSNTHSISDNQDYFEYIVKKRGEKTVNPSIRIYINEIENRITFEIKTQHLELLTRGTMKLPVSTKSNINQYENGENVSNLENTGVVLVHHNVANSEIQESCIYFVPNKSFGHLLDILPFLKNIWFRIYVYWSMVY